MDRIGRRGFDPTALTSTVSDLLTVRRVFGEAYERDGVRVIPVAKVLGGTGTGYGSGTSGPAASAEPAASAGSAGPEGSAVPREGGATGQDTSPEGEGGGGGFGVRVRPVGVYVVDDTGVSWHPALDVTRIVLGGQLVGMVAALALAWALRRRA